MLGNHGVQRIDVDEFEHRGRRFRRTRIGDTGLIEIETEKFIDARGTFMETWSYSLFEKLGLPTLWLQDNLSFSKRGVIRGMHIQAVNCQGKLIHCLQGAIQDVALDLRAGSATRGQWFSTNLVSSGDTAKWFYLPEGFAHGLLALESSIVSYKCTSEYVATADGGVQPMSCGIKWLVEREVGDGLNISNKDNCLPSLVDYLNRTT
jgi:dTDP-4-dehydrorhamnose 3,5-epimerase